MILLKQTTCEIIEMTNLIFRLAVETDLQAVLEISYDVYGGHDYFIGEFLNFLNDQSRRILIAEKDRKAVGLQVMQIVDGRETVIAQALRVHLKYRCQGIGKRLIQECRDYVKEHFPEIKRERYTVTSEAIERLAIQKKSDDVLFHKIAFFGCFVDSNSFNLDSRLARCPSVRHLNVKHLSEIEFERALEQDCLKSILFKNQYIVHWQPLKPALSNIPNGLIKNGDSFFASFSGESVQSLSHSRWCPIVKSPQLFTACYTLDKELLKAHVVQQLENAVKQHPKETFLFVCLVDISLVDCASEFLLSDLSLKNLKEEFEKYYHLFFFEKSLM